MTTEELIRLPGLARIRALMAADPGSAGLTGLLGMGISTVDEGRVTFAGTPATAFVNLVGIVHGGWAATLLDSAMGCAGHTLLAAGQALVTVEIKVAYHRPIATDMGTVEATGVVISHSRRTVFAEAKLLDAQSRLLASGTSTLMVLEPR